MASLLGDRMCMESLRKDITDLQGTLIDVFFRVGAVRYPSWKFPDKVSCDLDLVHLLEKYDHVEEDPEFTQLSHVVLLELVIDRLLLLLQSFTGYTELISSEGAIPQNRPLGPSMSIGLAVRKYWNHMLKLGSAFQQMKSSVHPKMIGKGNESSCSSSSRLTFASSLSQSSRLTPSVSVAQLCVAQDTRTVGSQTLESALVPCDACATAQSSLREVSNAIISVCNNQNLPCSLTKIKEMLPSGVILSPSEMRYWASEESKDLARISKHLTELTQVISPLRNQLEEARLENERLQKNIENCKKQLISAKEEHQRKTKEGERLVQEKRRQSEEMMNKLEKDKEELQKGTAVLEERVLILKKELASQQSTIRDLELSQNQLLDEMKSMVDKDEMLALEQKMRDLNDQLKITNQRLQESEKAMSKERARGESLQSHEESLQIKQRSLLQQLDRLSQECEGLRDRLEDTEEERTKLEEEIEGLETEKHSLRNRLEEHQGLVIRLQKEKQSLEESVAEMDKTLRELQESIQELCDREKLLVSYPELHSVPVFESSGDITEDMEKQLQANSIRISILEEENSKLRASLSKLRERSQQGPVKIVPQTQLWSIPYSAKAASPQHSSQKPSIPQTFSVQPKDTPPGSADNHRDRRVPSASTRQNLNLVTIPPENSPIVAYARLKGRNRTPSSDRK
ncbi:coiled-coil domain-containing protein 157 isoform X2 [Bombina bombina]|uniref:coiled-coil domain-containing protein 157 isoform X2 n=1 Tax=Bombina bombina TaxID=8345 RepID=UPI00235AB78F|nr:coiled-coil domain-containing protein 157 isoform X2 [Bombina bombina]